MIFRYHSKDGKIADKEELTFFLDSIKMLIQNPRKENDGFIGVHQGDKEMGLHVTRSGISGSKRW